jgi:hypothetical protein
MEMIMATRSRIGRLNDDGTVDSIYCNWDGYIAYVGYKLQTHWTDPDKVDQLMELGDISELGEVIGVPHESENPYNYGTAPYDRWEDEYGNMCVVYGRDCGEDNTSVMLSSSVKDFLAIDGSEYYYLFCDGEWLVKHVEWPDFMELESVLRTTTRENN